MRRCSIEWRNVPALQNALIHGGGRSLLTRFHIPGGRTKPDDAERGAPALPMADRDAPNRADHVPEAGEGSRRPRRRVLQRLAVGRAVEYLEISSGIFPESLPGCSGSEVGDRPHHGVPHSGIVERMSGPLDATDLGRGPHRAERV